MIHARNIDLINDLLARPAETSWIEFKKDNANPEKIGKYCSALSNAARIDDQACAYILWGIEDQTHKIVGTKFDPDTATKGSQSLQIWLAQHLKPSIAFIFEIVTHPEGRVVILTLPAAHHAPVSFDDTAYIRIGSATPKLSDYPDRFQMLIEALRPYTWERVPARSYVESDEVLQLLDYTGYFRLIRQPLPNTQVSILDTLHADKLIEPDVGNRWNITNLGAILFATNLDAFNTGLARKQIRFIAYAGKNKVATVTHRKDYNIGYANCFEDLINHIHGLIPKNEHIGQALREDRPLFPKLAIRELIVNALIHQDMTISGVGPQIELFKNRIEITNPGSSLVEVERMIDLPPRSRNESLASLMRRMGFCEEQGSGLDKTISEVEMYQLPAPLFRAENNTMQVILYGPRSFAQMSPDERIRACYHHAVLKWLSGEKMKNASLCQRFGLDKKNAAQATRVINGAIDKKLIKIADSAFPRGGYYPIWT